MLENGNSSISKFIQIIDEELDKSGIPSEIAIGDHADADQFIPTLRSVLEHGSKAGRTPDWGESLGTYSRVPEQDVPIEDADMNTECIHLAKCFVHAVSLRLFLSEDEYQDYWSTFVHEAPSFLADIEHESPLPLECPNAQVIHNLPQMARKLCDLVFMAYDIEDFLEALLHPVSHLFPRAPGSRTILIRMREGFEDCDFYSASLNSLIATEDEEDQFAGIASQSTEDEDSDHGLMPDKNTDEHDFKSSSALETRIECSENINPTLTLDEATSLLGVTLPLTLQDLSVAYLAALEKSNPEKLSHMSDSIQLAAQHESERINKAYTIVVRKLVSD